MSFTCPQCGMTSHNPDDEREGYCGNCHEFTGRPVKRRVLTVPTRPTQPKEVPNE